MYSSLLFIVRKLDFLTKPEKERLVGLNRSYIQEILSHTKGVEDFWVFHHSIISKSVQTREEHP